MYYYYNHAQHIKIAQTCNVRKKTRLILDFVLPIKHQCLENDKQTAENPHQTKVSHREYPCAKEKTVTHLFRRCYKKTEKDIKTK